jgi:twitching motility protein PilT
LIEAIESKASDVHITVGMPPLMRVNGLLTKMRDYVLKPEHTAYICLGMLNEKQKEILEERARSTFPTASPMSAASASTSIASARA